MQFACLSSQLRLPVCCSFLTLFFANGTAILTTGYVYIIGSPKLLLQGIISFE